LAPHEDFAKKNISDLQNPHQKFFSRKTIFLFGKPSIRFGGRGDAGTRRGEALISDKRRRVAAIHHGYKVYILHLTLIPCSA